MRVAGFVVLGLFLVIAAYAVFSANVLNPRVIRELETQPDGDRARKAMLLTLPSGKTIPVNYLRDGDKVYAAADFPWWRQLRGEGESVQLLVRGQRLVGDARAVENDPSLRTSVFERLRPTAPAWTGTLIEISLEASD